jgi:hypothetical protein
MILFKSFGMGFNRFLFRIERADIDAFSLELKLRVPMVPAEAHAAQSRNILLHLPVVRVLRSSAFSKVISSIVERVVVMVVNFILRINTSKNHAMHHNNSLFTVIEGSAAGVDTSGVPMLLGEPIELRKIFVVASTNLGSLVLRKGNQAVRIIKRLLNCVSSYTWFHELTSNEFVLQPHFITGVL